MFIPSPSIDITRLKDHSLILPVVSIGNVGQLAIDILLSTLITNQSTRLSEANNGEGEKANHIRQSKNDEDKLIVPLGSVYSTNISPYVGYEIFDRSRNKKKKTYDNDPINNQKNLIHQETKKTLCTSLELYLLPQSKYVILQQRSSVVPSRRNEFIHELLDWMKECGMKDLLLLSGSGMHKHEELLPQNQIERLSYLDLYLEEKDINELNENIDENEEENKLRNSAIQNELEALHIPCLNKAIDLQPSTKLTLNYPGQSVTNSALCLSLNQPNLHVVEQTNSNGSNTIDFPSHCGMSKLYYEGCKKNRIRGYIFLYRCSEGDNVGDGAFMLSFLISLLKLDEFLCLQNFEKDAVHLNTRFTLPRSFELLEGEMRNISL